MTLEPETCNGMAELMQNGPREARQIACEVFDKLLSTASSCQVTSNPYHNNIPGLTRSDE